MSLIVTAIHHLIHPFTPEFLNIFVHSLHAADQSLFVPTFTALEGNIHLRSSPKPATIQGMTDETELTPNSAEDTALDTSAEEVDAAEPATSEPEALETVPQPSDSANTESQSASEADDQMYSLIALETDGLDVDQALAAVASLSDLVAEREAAADAVEQAAAEAEEAHVETETRPDYPPFPKPPLLSLQRGQMASVVPALVLMLIGAWLTLALTNQTPPPGWLVVSVVGGGIGVTFLAQWLGSGRWSNGALLLGSGILFSAIVFAVLAAETGLVQDYPFFVVAWAGAFLLTGILAHPPHRRLTLIGLALAVSGIAALGVTNGMLDSTLLSTLANFWWVIVIALVVIWLLPIIQRLRP